MSLLQETAGSGSPGAGVTFLDFHAPAIFTYCFSLLGERDAAGDALHATFLRAWTGGGADLCQTPLGRLLALARAECRLRGGRDTSPAAGSDDRAGRAIARVLRRLRPKDAEALELSVRFGLDDQGLGVVFGLPPEQAGRLGRDARQLFFEALREELRVSIVDEPVLVELARQGSDPWARLRSHLPFLEPTRASKRRVLHDFARLDPAIVASARAEYGGAAPAPRAGASLRAWRSATATLCMAALCVGLAVGIPRPPLTDPHGTHRRPPQVSAPTPRPIRLPPRSARRAVPADTTEPAALRQPQAAHRGRARRQAGDHTRRTAHRARWILLLREFGGRYRSHPDRYGRPRYRFGHRRPDGRRHWGRDDGSTGLR